MRIDNRVKGLERCFLDKTIDQIMREAKRLDLMLMGCNRRGLRASVEYLVSIVYGNRVLQRDLARQYHVCELTVRNVANRVLDAFERVEKT